MNASKHFLERLRVVKNTFTFFGGDLATDSYISVNKNMPLMAPSLVYYTLDGTH